MIMDNLIAPTASFFLIVVALHLAVAYFYSRKRKAQKYEQVVADSTSSSTKNQDLEKAILLSPPGPTPYPIVGNLPTLSKYEDDPFAGFSVLAKEYGPVFALQMGSTPAVVVSSFEGIKEVLIKKGNAFDARPNFQRWNAYFDNDRQQSLALCDWSDIQKTRRNVCRSFLILKQQSPKFMDLDSWLGSEMTHLLDAIKATEGKASLTKLPISYCAMNVFLGYLCSTRFDYSEEKFTKITKCFDLIFEDINNGHPTDFLPWLSPFFKSYKKSINDLASTIRQFILDEIIKDRAETFDPKHVNDLVDALLSNYLAADGRGLNLGWQNILFALEDLLGGSAAISNIIMRIFSYVARNPSVQEKLHQEIDEVLGSDRIPTLEDKPNMKYSEAVILEALRHTSSPIVPHVATEDTSIEGFLVEKDTIVFLNNHELNVSPSLWENPAEFKPERFLVNNEIKKPAHFLPFSTGKRSCIGSRILMNVTFVTISTILQKYIISLPQGETGELPPGKLALVGDGFPMILDPRN